MWKKWVSPIFQIFQEGKKNFMSHSLHIAPQLESLFSQRWLNFGMIYNRILKEFRNSYILKTVRNISNSLKNISSPTKMKISQPKYFFNIFQKYYGNVIFYKLSDLIIFFFLGRMFIFTNRRDYLQTLYVQDISLKDILYHS